MDWTPSSLPNWQPAKHFHWTTVIPSDLGKRRAANMRRVPPSVIRSRHGAYLDRWYREHEERHNDGVNRLVVRFAREGVETIAGWRGEINVLNLTQVRPDLLVQVTGGTLGPGLPLHRVRAPRGGAPPGGAQAGTLPPDAGSGPAVTAADGLRDGAGAAELPGRRRNAALAYRHAGAGAGQSGDGSGYGVEPERAAGGAPLPGLTGAPNGGAGGRDTGRCNQANANSLSG